MKNIYTVIYIYLCSYMSPCFLLLYMDLCHSLISCHNGLTAPFGISCRVDLLMTNPQFLFMWKYFNLSFILEGQFDQTQNFWLTVFFRQHFEYGNLLLSGLHGFGESAVNLVGNTLYVVSHFSLSAHKMVSAIFVLKKKKVRSEGKTRTCTQFFLSSPPPVFNVISHFSFIRKIFFQSCQKTDDTQNHVVNCEGYAKYKTPSCLCITP